jgi:uncharacterized protein YjbJ (UPF0337 family)
MGMEDRAAGKVKQAKGKANDVAGAAKGDTGQQIKGKAQNAVGKVQDKLGKKSWLLKRAKAGGPPRPPAFLQRLLIRLLHPTVNVIVEEVDGLFGVAGVLRVHVAD